MKCPDCGGTGVIHFRNIHVLCRKCKALGFIDDEPKPKKQMTEQEYIQTCNTEQLAEFIIGVRKGCVYADCPNGETPCMSCKDGCDIDKLVEWLKQPHTPIS